MVIIQHYTVKRDEKGILHIKGSTDNRCSICGGRLLSRDTRKRIYMTADGHKDKICVRRLQCAVCKKIHTELPLFLIPEKRYDASLIMSQLSITDNAAENICQAENSTMYRWRKELNTRMSLWYRFFIEMLTILIRYQASWESYSFLLQRLSQFNQMLEQWMRLIDENIYNMEKLIYYFDKNIHFL